MNEQGGKNVEEDERPWDQPKQDRRDCLPQRSDFLLRWARGGVFCILVSICFFPAVVLGIVICLVVAVVARNDLAEIGKEARNKSGEVETRRALNTAVIGLLIAIPVGSYGFAMLMYVYSLISSVGTMG